MRNRNIFLLLALAVLWGPSFVFIKIAVLEIPPLTLVAIRLSLAAVFLSVILLIKGSKLERGWHFWKKFIFMGFFANALPFVLFSYGEQYADSGAAAILNGTTPIFTVLFAHFFVNDERVSLNRLGGVILGFAGILVIFFPDLQHFLSGQDFQGGLQSAGLMAFIGASFSYGIAIVYGRIKLRGLPPLVGPAAQLICSASMILPLALIVDKPFNLTPGVPALLAASVLGIFGTAFAYLVYYKLVDSAGATFISLVTYLLPPIGLILGIVFLDEQPLWYSFVGMGLILAGVIIVNRLGRKRRPQTHQAPVVS